MKIMFIPQVKQLQQQVQVVDKIDEHNVIKWNNFFYLKTKFLFLVSPTTTLTTDRRHSHFNRISTLNNPSLTSQQQNSDDDDDNESVSTQSTQPISLTSFIHPTTTTTNDYNTGVNLSLRQTRQRMNTNENHNTWQTRTRYSTRSSTSNRNPDENYDNHHQQQNSSSRILSASDDDNDIASNSKRNRIERSDRRISSVNRPNYKIDSDEHEDDEDDQQKTNTMNDNQEDMKQTEQNNVKDKGRMR